jgi:hypothetical protein
MYVCVYVCMLCMYVCIHTYMYVCIHAYMFMDVCITGTRSECLELSLEAFASAVVETCTEIERKQLLQRIEFALEARGRYAKETYYRGKRETIQLLQKIEVAFESRGRDILKKSLQRLCLGR